MSARSNRNEKLYDALGIELLRRVKTKEASAADLQVARQYLRDAGIGEDTDHPSGPTRALEAALAEHDAEEQLH